MSYLKFHVRRKEQKYIKPYRRIPYVVFNYNQLKTMKAFVKQIEKKFNEHVGTFLLYTNENKAAIKFTMSDNKMSVIYKTNSGGFTYPLFRRWRGERVILNKRK
jgi:hypothetical protein|tara:strand:+ start:854 stop:1165 length:312 start_codon:yes stop_codon:yes gene_type:complete